MRSTRPSPPQYRFETQHALGKQAEQFLDHYFARWYIIQTIDLATEIRDGYDRIFIRKHDQQAIRVEYKADWQAAATGNAFIETISIYEERKPGWAHTSQADMLIYFVPQMGQVYMLPLAALRLILPSWKLRYREVPAPNEGYKTYGILVPLTQFSKFGALRVVPKLDLT
jgi:hypothetical protein